MHQRNTVASTRGWPRRLPLLAALSIAVTVAACGLLDPEITETGRVRFEDVEGGCWLIDTEAERYFPINLPQNLQVDGLEVLFDAKSRLDLGTFCPGVVIEIIHISEVEG